MIRLYVKVPQEFMRIIIIIIIIIIILLFWEFSTQALADGFLQESEWQQKPSSLQNSS